MRVWAAGAALAAGLGLLGCGPSGVRVDVHATLKLDTLVLYAAVKDPSGQLVIDPRLDGVEVGVGGRNLDRSPYQVLLEPADGTPDGAEVVLAVVGRAGGSDVAFGELVPPERFRGGQIAIRQLELGAFSGAPPFNGLDTGCLQISGVPSLGSRDDRDCDGYKSTQGGGDDCDDTDPTIHPGAPEICGNGKDDNCNGMVDEDVDADGDGVTTCAGDCDDADPAVHPGAAEICDGKDNNCDGSCDEGFDGDGDGYTTCGSIRHDGGLRCEAPQPAAVDCLDSDPTVYPGAPEICDGKDNNCDGTCDEGFDGDGDSYTTCGSRTDHCGAPPTPAFVDCDDGDALVHPNQGEFCDGYDDNCDGTYAPADETCFADPGTGCALGSRPCSDMSPPGFTAACAPGMDAAPAEWCAAYAACDAGATRDKLGCTTEMVAGQILRCQLAFVGDVLCPNASVALPGPASGTCAYALDGPVTRDGYTLGLLDGTGTPQTTSALCTPLFGVTAFGGAAGTEGPTAAFMRLDVTGGATSRVALLIAPMAVASCPAAGLSCR